MRKERQVQVGVEIVMELGRHDHAHPDGVRDDEQQDQRAGGTFERA
jgi:hypothetical protein